MSGIQQLFLGGSSVAAYQIERSLRFNSADSAYLNRTPASAGNRKTWTWSGWVKISSLPVNNALFAAYKGSGSVDNEFFALYFSSGALRAGGWSTTYLESSAVYRDFSAWYHVVCTIDTTSATSNNRVRLYINGSEITAFQTRNNPNQNTDLGVNQNTLHQIGQNGGFGAYFNGYMTEVNFIDGQALTPSSFGETDADTGVWKPKAYSGSYGTNGFYLKFADNSGTTSTTLGKDSSGNSNNWTPNNFSVTAGAGNDSLVDSPTQYGTDTGAGGEVRGNYCTLSPIYALNVTYNTPTNGNLDVALSNNSGSYGTFSFTTGKWYWEITVASAISSAGYVGLMDSTFIKTDNTWSSQARNYVSDGSKYNGSTSAYGATWGNGDIIGVAVDMDAGTIVFYKNGSSQGTAFSDLIGKEWKPMVWAPSGTYTLNFGQRPFAYTAPSGFKALCTTNLPTPTIGATATTRADDYFNAVIWDGTGSGTTRAISGVGFQPDFVWAKARSAAYSHSLYDAVRGAGSEKELTSNATAAEGGGNQNQYGYLSSFDSDGFTSTAGTEGAALNLYFNESGKTYVAWNWKANGAGSSNTQGTITSTVSANTTAGFSIVTYTGNGTNNATVGHGLGAAPSMIIVKNRSGSYGWLVLHTSVGTTGTTLDGSPEYYMLLLNATDARADFTNDNIWNPTSTTFKINGAGTGNYVNANGINYVAYCFAPVAGYSAFGSYTGNGSTDGPFIYTGFRPKYVLIKPSTVVDSWQVEDAARSPFNVVNDQLWPNLSDAEQVDSATRQTDFVSNGFKIRGTNTGVNGNGTTYVYACFAEFPFKYTLAR